MSENFTKNSNKNNYSYFKNDIVEYVIVEKPEMYVFRLLVFKKCQKAIIRFWRETMEEEEISLGEIFAIIKQRLLLIISLGIVGLLASALYTFFLVTPMYDSTTQLLVNRTSDSANEIQLSDINTNVQMINTYKDIIKGPVILGDVKDNLASNYTVGELGEMVTIGSNENSQVFSMTVTSADPVEAAEIANEIATTFQANIGEIMKVENVSIISEAVVNPNPISPNVLMNLMLGALVGGMLGLGLAFLQHFMDRTIRDNQFIGQTIGWPDLGVISEMDGDEIATITQYQVTETAKSRRERVR